MLGRGRMLIEERRGERKWVGEGLNEMELVEVYVYQARTKKSIRHVDQTVSTPWH